MKAGRLLSILLLLQARGRMTAAALAEELEVSVRTVYRDVESLHAAGIPLYGDAGHRGGYQLAEDTEAPFLAPVADAVRTGRVLAVRYRRWKEPTDVDRRLEPYGLVLKAGRWYLVAGPGPRTYRVDQILGLTVTDEEAVVPEGFDLATHWRASQADFHARLHQGEALVRISPRGAARLTGAAAGALAATGVPEPDGWTRATLPVESPEHAHDMLLALGTEVEVLAPEDLRERVAATVRTLAERYG
ncbi:helix-turn-helix transcriptional regulator [Streptomyces sp. NPDC058718]|uniref:helix-turn-helix transcriptional regulator n=1 Tax=Streptomyces sp. NPDC058718 TaxID=3346610 RepID=UPI0036AA7701